MRPRRFSRPTTRRAGGGLAVLIAFGGGVAAVVGLGGGSQRVAVDEGLFHLDAVRQFARQWPRPDLHDYASATTPGYHLLLAAVAHYVSDDLRVLRVVGGCFGVALVALVAAAASRRSVWLALPLAGSWYVLTSTVGLLPENAAWLGVTAALLLAAYAEGVVLYAGSAAVLTLLVFVRQSAVWTLAPFVTGSAAALLGRTPSRENPHDAAGPSGGNNARIEESAAPAAASRPIGSVLAAVAAVLPAVGVLLAFVLLWHGLTPPSFQPGSGVDRPLATKVGGVAPAGPATVLTLMAVFGGPLLGWLWPRTADRRARGPLAGPVARVAGFGMLAGFVLGVLPATDYAPPDRRTGFWAVVARVPSVGHHSPLVVLLATLGGGVVAVALARLRPRERGVLAAAAVGFTLAQMATTQLWQRYYEPFVLLWLALAASGGGPETPPSARRRAARAAGLAAVVALQLAAVAYRLRHPE